MKIVEVGPRDGLQNEPVKVPTNVKVELINRLVAAGLCTVEATRCVWDFLFPSPDPDCGTNTLLIKFYT